MGLGRTLVWGGVFLAAAVGAGCGMPADDRPIDPATGIRNFAQVADGLYRGGQPDAEGFARLKAMGVRTVVSLRTFNVDRPLLKGLGLRYLHVSFKAGHPEDEDIVAFLKVATDPGSRPVFIHCHWGTDRTGMMVAAYRMVVQDWPCGQAVEEMLQMGFRDEWWGMLHHVHTLNVGALRQELHEGGLPEVETIP